MFAAGSSGDDAVDQLRKLMSRFQCHRTTHCFTKDKDGDVWIQLVDYFDGSFYISQSVLEIHLALLAFYLAPATKAAEIYCVYGHPFTGKSLTQIIENT